MPKSYRIDLSETASEEVLSRNLEECFTDAFPLGESTFITRLLGEIGRLFRGEHPDYAAIDMAYHNLEHTHQTALCLARMFAGRKRIEGLAPVTPDDFRRALAAMFFHDTGYLKAKGDEQGTGAKYTFVHEQRSADLAASILTGPGWSADDIAKVKLFILSTGPSSRPDRLPFENAIDRELGSMVCTADFLGQMSDPNYPKKIPALFNEFREAYDVRGISEEMRPYHTVHEMVSRTCDFWEKFVEPKLTKECGAVYRYLEISPGGGNPYLDAVKAHLATFARERDAGPPRRASA